MILGGLLACRDGFWVVVGEVLGEWVDGVLLGLSLAFTDGVKLGTIEGDTLGVDDGDSLGL